MEKRKKIKSKKYDTRSLSMLLINIHKNLNL